MHTVRIAAGAALGLAMTHAFAHEGHGAPGASHWHASDTFGLVLVAALAVCAIWFSRGGK